MFRMLKLDLIFHFLFQLLPEINGIRPIMEFVSYQFIATTAGVFDHCSIVVMMQL